VARIWFWTAQDDGASWYRADQPAQALQWAGHETWVSQVPIPSVAAKADVIVVSRPARPEALRRLVEVRERYGCRVVADLDDDYWSMEPGTPAYQSWHVDEDGALIKGLEEGLKLADAVTVASVGEAMACAEHGVDPDKIAVVPNGLHASILGMPRDYERGTTNDGVLTIGWAGTASSIAGLDLVGRALSRALERYAGKLRVRLVGFDSAAAPDGFRRAMTHPADSPAGQADVGSVEWVPHGNQYLAAVAMFDIWLAPYHNTAFNRAKFPTKALEAGFWGIPLIASDIDPYAEWFARTHQADHARLVSEYTPHEWSRQLCALIESPELRRRYGEAGRSAAATYSLQEVGRRWESVLLG
jgi:glycosyltransferase involved in cell wall biosynthesis